MITKHGIWAEQGNFLQPGSLGLNTEGRGDTSGSLRGVATFRQSRVVTEAAAPVGVPALPPKFSTSTPPARFLSRLFKPGASHLHRRIFLDPT